MPAMTPTDQANMQIAEFDTGPELTIRLVGRCVAGEREAWHALHRRYYPVAGAFLRRLGVRGHELEDACQDVFLEVFRCLAQFRGESEFRTWLYRLCITQARKTRTRQRVLGLVRWALSRETRSEVDRPFEESIAAQRVEKAIAQLSESEKVVFVLFELEGVAGKQIAEIVGCPEATVWRRLHYARRRFKDALDTESECSS